MDASLLRAAPLRTPWHAPAGPPAPSVVWLTRLWRLSRCTVVLLPRGTDRAAQLLDDLLPLVARRAGDRETGEPTAVGPGTAAGTRTPERALVWSADAGMPPDRLAPWHAKTAGRLLVAIQDAEDWLAGGPALAAANPQATAWLGLLRDPRLPVHALLALDERCEPWLAGWVDAWPGLGEQTLRWRDDPPTRAADAGTARASPAAIRACDSTDAARATAVHRAAASRTAALHGAAEAAPTPPPTTPGLPSTVLAAAGLAVLAMAAGNAWLGSQHTAASATPYAGQPQAHRLMPAPPVPPTPASPSAQEPPSAQLLRLARAAGLTLVPELDGLRPDTVAWVGYDALHAAWLRRSPAVQVLTPLWQEDLRFQVPPHSPLRHLHEAANLPMTAADARAGAAGEHAWRLVFGRPPVRQAREPGTPSALRVALGDSGTDGWRTLRLDPAHPGTLRARRHFLPGTDGGLAILSYLVTGPAAQAPPPSALQSLGDSLCTAWPSLRQAKPLPAPWPEHPGAGLAFAGCTANGAETSGSGLATPPAPKPTPTGARP